MQSSSRPHPALIGMGSDKVVPLLTGLAEDAPRAERLKERRGEIFRHELLPHLRPFPRARELLEGARTPVDGPRGRHVGVRADDLNALLERAGVADLMDATVSSDDVDRSKPDPDIVATALEKARRRPDEAVLVGDTPYDVAAARRAGVPAIAVRSGGWSDERAARRAGDIVDDVAALCASLDDVIPRGVASEAGRTAAANSSAPSVFSTSSRRSHPRRAMSMPQRRFRIAPSSGRRPR